MDFGELSRAGEGSVRALRYAGLNSRFARANELRNRSGIPLPKPTTCRRIFSLIAETDDKSSVWEGVASLDRQCWVCSPRAVYDRPTVGSMNRKSASLRGRRKSKSA